MSITGIPTTERHHDSLQPTGNLIGANNLSPSTQTASSDKHTSYTYLLSITFLLWPSPSSCCALPYTGPFQWTLFTIAKWSVASLKSDIRTKSSILFMSLSCTPHPPLTVDLYCNSHMSSPLRHHTHTWEGSDDLCHVEGFLSAITTWKGSVRWNWHAWWSVPPWRVSISHYYMRRQCAVKLTRVMICATLKGFYQPLLHGNDFAEFNYIDTCQWKYVSFASRTSGHEFNLNVLDGKTRWYVCGQSNQS